MLLVNATKGPSNIHGLGLFAREFIPVGTKVWKYSFILERMYSDLMLNDLSKYSMEQVKFYSWWNEDMKCYILSGDDDRFTNSSDDPNTQFVSWNETVAVRDINVGEEITLKYD